MNLAFIAVLASIAAPISVAAEDLHSDYDFARDGIIHEIEQDVWPEATKVAPNTLFTSFTANGLRFELFDEPMSFFQEAFGSSRIQHNNSVGYVHEWMCFTSAGQRIWYLSNGGVESGIVDWLVVEPSNPASDASYGCTDEPRALLDRPGRFPATGTTLAELNAQFHVALPAGTTRAVFSLEEEDKDSLIRTAYYRLKDDVVDAVSFSQWQWQE